MKKYIVLHTDEDGDIGISHMSEKEIKEDFLVGDTPPYKVFNKLPNLGYCGEGILIIEGKIMVPKAKEKVIKWEL